MLDQILFAGIGWGGDDKGDDATFFTISTAALPGNVGLPVIFISLSITPRDSV